MKNITSFINEKLSNQQDIVTAIIELQNNCEKISNSVAKQQIYDFMINDWSEETDGLKVNKQKINKMFGNATEVFYGEGAETTSPFTDILEENDLDWYEDASDIYEIAVGDPDNEEFNRIAYYKFGDIVVLYVGNDAGDDSAQLYIIH